MTEPATHADTCPDLRAMADLARDLAAVSGPVIRRQFRTGTSVDLKADDSPVTQADRQSEAAMRALIERRMPDHGIIGEEYGSHNADAEFVWILDPVDGTGAFIAGLPTFSTLIGLAYRGQFVLGAVHQPVLGEFWLGGTGIPTTLNGQAVAPPQEVTLADALLYTTDPDLFSTTDRPAFDRLSAAVRRRRLGADGYAGALLASGHGNIWIEAGLQIYDLAALVPLIRAAGGTVTDWQGRAVDQSSYGQVLAAASTPLHADALKTLMAGS